MIFMPSAAGPGYSRSDVWETIIVYLLLLLLSTKLYRFLGEPGLYFRRFSLVPAENQIFYSLAGIYSSAKVGGKP